MSSFNFQPPSKLRTHQRTLASLTLVVVALAFALFKTTFASNISLNNSQSVEYGQGISQAVACSGGSNITVTPIDTFNNASGGGSFSFSGFTVIGVPSSCYGYDLQINAYDGTNNAPLPLYNGSSTDVVVWDTNGVFNVGTSIAGLTITTNSTSSFTVTFTSPVANAGSIYKIGVQSSSNSVIVSTLFYDVTNIVSGWSPLNSGISGVSNVWNFTATTGTQISEVDLKLNSAYTIANNSSDPTIYLYSGSSTPVTQIGILNVSSTSGAILKFTSVTPIAVPSGGVFWVDISTPNSTSSFTPLFRSSVPTNSGTAGTNWTQGGQWSKYSSVTSQGMAGSNINAYVSGYYLNARIIGS